MGDVRHASGIFLHDPARAAPDGPAVYGASKNIDTLTNISTVVNMTSVKLIQTIDAECCPQLLAEPLDEQEAERLAAALRVLADPARLRLLSIIGAHPNGEACVCDLTAPIGLSQPTVSHHLKVLADAGLVGREKRGRWAYFWVLPEPLELLRGALAAPVGTGEPSHDRPSHPLVVTTSAQTLPPNGKGRGSPTSCSSRWGQWTRPVTASSRPSLPPSLDRPGPARA